MELHDANIENDEIELSLNEWNLFYNELCDNNYDVSIECVDIAKILTINFFIKKDVISQVVSIDRMREQFSSMDQLSTNKNDKNIKIQSNKIRYIHNLLVNNTSIPENKDMYDQLIEKVYCNSKSKAKAKAKPDPLCKSKEKIRNKLFIKIKQFIFEFINKF